VFKHALRAMGRQIKNIMKKNITILMLAILFGACKNNSETKPVKVVEDVIEKVATPDYPEAISKLFKAHGTIEKWNTMAHLEFTMKKESGDEKTTTALKSRKSLIETKDFTIGYNGKEPWFKENGDYKYKGNPQFYYNLMFYFYAMPFVVGDDGITYTNVEPLEANGKDYPGIKISYDAGVGESPEDEYIVYYDSETNKMAWLGYTVTYFTKAKSTDWHFIKYAEWQTVNGLVLPSRLEWYKSEGFAIGEKRNGLVFVDIVLSETEAKDEFFENPKIEE